MKNYSNTLWILSVSLSLAACSFAPRGGGEASAKPASGEVLSLSKADFLVKVFNYEQHPEAWRYAGDKPCIIDFYADWCAPCRKVSPILGELALRYRDDLLVYKVDVDAETELASVFGIRSIPSLLFVPVEGEPRMAGGALSFREIEEQINGFLLKEPAP
ncbi:MAG: thiol reductase thioredoxin [Tannerellaceae bacterium]|nr:thiol reductase thioredoxin [Tannerellaceae bacterium]